MADQALVEASRKLSMKASVVMGLHRDAMVGLQSPTSDDAAIAAMEKVYNEYLDLHHPFNQLAKNALGELVAID